MPRIHPTAVVAEGAGIETGVVIGPYCIVGPDVRIDSGTELMSHVVVSGRTHIGRRNRIFPFASIGQEPQDLKYHGEPSRIEIGDDNTLREYVTVNTGTEGGGMITRIGNGTLLMAYAHVAHDCQVGNEAILANCATLAGHIVIGDGAIIGGLTAIHQFVRIGRYAMVGGMCGVNKDVPPYCLVMGGYRAGLAGLNLIGLKRRGFTQDTIRRLKRVYKVLLQGRGPLEERLRKAAAPAAEDPHAREMVEFVRAAERGVTMHRGAAPDLED